MDSGTTSIDYSYHLAMRENRLRGERVIAVFRIVMVLCAAAGFAASGLAAAGLYGAPLPYLYLGALAASALFSTWVIYTLKNRGYRRFIPFISTTVDITAISLTVLVVLRYAVEPSRALIYLTVVYSVYHLAILLSIRRYDPQNGLFAGGLAAVQYLAIALVFGLFQGEPAVSGFGGSSWYRIVVSSELVKGFVLFLGGVLAYALARNLTLRLLSATRVEGAYLSQFFESTPEAIVLSDNETRILRINDAFSRLFGYSEQEALGRSIDELVVPEDFQTEALELTHSAQEGRQFLIDTVRQRKDRSPVDVSILGAPIFVRGRQVAIFGIYRDVTERKRKERLFQALNRAALAMQGALSHQQILDAVGEQLEQLGYGWNVLLLEEDGRSLRLEHLVVPSRLLRNVERMIGMTSSDIVIPVDCDADLIATVKEGETRFVEDSTAMVRAILPAALKGLAPRIVKTLGVGRTIGAPLMVESRIIGALGVHSPGLDEMDLPAITAFANQLSTAWQKITLIGKLEQNITELQQTQQQLTQAQKMEAVGRLAGGIAHDFNNLLTVIKGYSELLLNEHDLEPPVRDTVSEIHKAGDQASQLTGHLLAFSRKQTFRPRVVDINDTIRGMEKILQRLIGEDVELETRLETKLDPVRIDPHQIEQVIMNLAVNARDAMPGGGKLHLETANIYLGTDFVSKHPEVIEGPYVLLAMTDMGTGIREEILPQIFEPFFTTKERGRGTGLGLSTVYGIVKQSLGYVYAENAPERGARFALYFPTAEGEERASRTADQSQEESAGTETILLVEDEESVRHLTQTILERSGYRVVSISDAETALSLPPGQLEEINVLITDVVMPGMNGRVLADRLTGICPGLKVLFLSGYAADITGVDLSVDHPGELLQKPFSRNELLQKLRELLDE